MCTYMYIYIDYRWDVSTYNELRSAASNRNCLNDPKKHLGCIHPPLLNFEINRIVIDELHLMLRITDILIRNLGWAMVYYDHKENVRGVASRYLKNLQNHFQSKLGYTHVELKLRCYLHVHVGLGS